MESMATTVPEKCPTFEVRRTNTCVHISQCEIWSLSQIQSHMSTRLETDQSTQRGHLETDQSTQRGHLETDQSTQRGHLETDQSTQRGHLQVTSIHTYVTSTTVAVKVL